MELATEEKKKPTEKLVEATGDLIETYRNLIEVGIAEKVSKGASSGALGMIYVFAFLFTILFAGIGSAWWVGEAMGNMKMGFFIVGAFFMLLLVMLILMSRKIILPGIRNMIIRKFYEQD